MKRLSYLGHCLLVIMTVDNLVMIGLGSGMNQSICTTCWETHCFDIDGFFAHNRLIQKWTLPCTH
jgi:hypothetical protein